RLAGASRFFLTFLGAPPGASSERRPGMMARWRREGPTAFETHPKQGPVSAGTGLAQSTICRHGLEQDRCHPGLKGWHQPCQFELRLRRGRSEMHPTVQITDPVDECGE